MTEVTNMLANVKINFDITMDSAAENSEITLKAHASDQLHRSTETIYSESSEEFQSKCKNAANILQKRKQVLSFLDGDSSPYRSVNFFPKRALSCTRLLKRNSMNSCSEKIMAEKVLQIKQLHNELSEARYQINELANENRLLLNIQKRQAVALRKYEGKKAELPQLMHSHSEEIRVLKSKLKELRAENSEKDQHLKGLHTELLTLKEKHRHLLKLARDRRLKEREQLSKQVEDLQQIIKEQDIKIQTLNRKVMLETKTCKHQLAVEISHHRDTRKALDEALEKIGKLERMLETKEKYIANFSPKRTLSKNYQQHSLSLGSWNAKTPRFSTQKTINCPGIDLTRNQNPAIEEASSEATYTASCTATSLGSPGSTNNIHSDREALVTAEARYQARRLRLAKKINRIKEKLSNHQDQQTNFTNDQSINTYFSDDDDDDDNDNGTFYDDKALNSEMEGVSRRTSLESCNVRYIDSIDKPQLANSNQNIQESQQDVETVVQKISEMSAGLAKWESEASVESSFADREELLHEKGEIIPQINKELNTHVSNGINNRNKTFGNPNLHEQFTKESVSSAHGEEKTEATVFEQNQNIIKELQFERKAAEEISSKENSTISTPNDTSFASESISNQKNSENGAMEDKFLGPKEKPVTQPEVKPIYVERTHTESRRNSANEALPKINISSENHGYPSTGMSSKNQEEYLSESATKINLPSAYTSKSKNSLQNLSEIVDLSVNTKSVHSSQQNLDKYKSLKCEKEIQNQNHSKFLTQDPAKKSKLLAALKAIDDGKDPETEYDIRTFGIKTEAKNIHGNEFQTKGNIFYEMDVKSLSTTENITFPSIDNNGSRRFSTISYWEGPEKQGNGNKISANKDELLRELFDKHDTEHKLKVQSSCSSEGKELLLDVLKPSQNLLEKN